MLWRESATVEHAWRWLAKKNGAQILGRRSGTGEGYSPGLMISPPLSPVERM
jgi:hypothetical protein